MLTGTLATSDAGAYIVIMIIYEESTGGHLKEIVDRQYHIQKGVIIHQILPTDTEPAHSHSITG